LNSSKESRKPGPGPRAAFAGFIAGLAAGLVSYLLIKTVLGFVIGFIAGLIVGYQTVLLMARAREEAQ
jgi:uncharacterized membrane protein YjjP (DUF1212 family)